MNYIKDMPETLQKDLNAYIDKQVREKIADMPIRVFVDGDPVDISEIDYSCGEIEVVICNTES